MRNDRYAERIRKAAAPVLDPGETVVCATNAVEGSSSPWLRPFCLILGVVGALIANAMWKPFGVALTDRRLVLLPMSLWWGRPVSKGAVFVPLDTSFAWLPGAHYSKLAFRGPDGRKQLCFAKRFRTEAETIARAVMSSARVADAEPAPFSVETAAAPPRSRASSAAGLWESH
jgi:hypothetical protein